MGITVRHNKKDTVGLLTKIQMMRREDENDTWLKHHIVNAFRPQSHNIQHYRIIYSFIPGKRIQDWLPDEAARNGHLFVVETLHDHDLHCSSTGGNLACQNGHLEIIEYLRGQTFTAQNMELTMLQRMAIWL